MKKHTLDATDRKILALLQENSRMSNAELADAIGMSATPCWRRHKELEESGYIDGYVAMVNRRAAGLPLCCMLHVSLTRHTEGAVETFENAMLVRPEVMECYEVTGAFDYIVKLLVADMDAYHDFLHNVMVKLPGVSQVNTSVALREVKYETALPL